MFISRDAVIELTIINNTSYPVSRAYFKGTVSSPGRSIPWVEEEFNYSIPGGVEPGEEQTWKLSPNMFGKWRNAPDDRDDLIFTVEVTRIDGADNQSIFETNFDEYDKERLEKLENKLLSLKDK